MKRIFIKLFLLISILIFLGLAALFISVDLKVGRVIESAKSPASGFIFSAPLEIGNDLCPGKQKIIKALNLRNYLAVDSNSLKPGEYRLINNDLYVFTREFKDHTNTEYGNIQIHMTLQDNKCEVQSPAYACSFMLEPMPFAPINPRKFETRHIVSVDDMSKKLIKAIVVVEDQRFFDHYGVDLMGVVRALYANLTAGKIVQGGSTISQQLIKNLFNNKEKSISRKFVEALASLSLERRLSKSEILELYVNEIYLGQDGSQAIHGFAAASQHFFQKNVTELDWQESAMLAGIIKAPSYYSPIKYQKRNRKRTDQVLKILYEKEELTKEEYKTFQDKPLKIKGKKTKPKLAPYFAERVRNQIADLDNPPKKVFTGLVPEMQKCGQSAVREGLKSIQQKFGFSNKRQKGLEGGLLALESKTGIVKTWVGGKNYETNQYDHTYLAKRQIGSTVKPFVYLTALDLNLNDFKAATTITILQDKPFQVDVPGGQKWRPKNYDNRFRGDVTLRYALEKSLNVPAAYISQRVGIDKVAMTLRDFGVSELKNPTPAIALGAIDTTLFQLTSAYATLANNGIKTEPRFTLQAKEKYYDGLKIAGPGPTFVLTNILQGVIERGTAKIIRSSGSKGTLAGKTGTSNDGRDSWLVTYGPNITIGAWVGFDDNSPSRLTGATGAGALVEKFIGCIEGYQTFDKFTAPGAVQLLDIDMSTGRKAHEKCPKQHVVREIFAAGTEPRYCEKHGGKEFLELAQKTETEESPERVRRGMLEDLFR